jgi:HlyD family secretion protein
VKTLRIPLYFAVILLIIMSGCSAKEITKQDTGKSQLPVKTDIVITKAISNSIELSGLAIPHIQIPIYTAQPLRVQKVHVKVGDEVSENDVLISLNNEVATQHLNDANETVAKLQTALSSAKQTIPTQEQLDEIKQLQKEVEEVLTQTSELLTNIQPGELTPEEVVQYSLELSLKQAQLANATSKLTPFSQASITELEAQLAQAKQGVEQARKLVAATEIISPINGIIASIDVVENGQAPPSIPIATVIQLNQIDATFQVNSFEVVKLTKDTEVSLTFTGLEEIYKGKIESISPSVNPETNMFTVIIPIENNNNLIKGGMKASATVSIDQVNDSLVVPVQAVLYDNNEPFVFIVENDLAVRKNLETGIRNDDYIQIISGLNLHDEIIIEGQERLKDGDPIYVSN